MKIYSNSFIIIFILLVTYSCTTKNGDNKYSYIANWHNEYEMVAADSSFIATIDYLPQDSFYNDCVYRLGITPILSRAADTIFNTIRLKQTKYFYGALSIQGSMHNHWYVFAYSERIGDGMFVFNGGDYTLQFPDDYEPNTFANRNIEMKPIGDKKL